MGTIKLRDILVKIEGESEGEIGKKEYMTIPEVLNEITSQMKSQESMFGEFMGRANEGKMKEIEEKLGNLIRNHLLENMNINAAATMFDDVPGVNKQGTNILNSEYANSLPAAKKPTSSFGSVSNAIGYFTELDMFGMNFGSATTHGDIANMFKNIRLEMKASRTGAEVGIGNIQMSIAKGVTFSAADAKTPENQTVFNEAAAILKLEKIISKMRYFFLVYYDETSPGWVQLKVMSVFYELAIKKLVDAIVKNIIPQNQKVPFNFSAQGSWKPASQNKDVVGWVKPYMALMGKSLSGTSAQTGAQTKTLEEIAKKENISVLTAFLNNGYGVNPNDFDAWYYVTIKNLFAEFLSDPDFKKQLYSKLASYNQGIPVRVKVDRSTLPSSPGY